MKQQNKLISIGEAAEYLNVSIDTLRRWEKKEKVKSYRSPGNHRYFIKEDLDKLFGKKYEHDAPRKKTMKKKEALEVPVTHEPEIDDNEELIETHAVPSHASVAYPTPIQSMQERILDRPTREVKVPEIELVRVIQEEKIEIAQNGIHETKVEQVETSILTPKAEEPVKKEPVIGIFKKAIKDKVAKEGKLKEKVAKPKTRKGNLLKYAVITVTILLVIATVFFFIGLSSQQMLSPVP